MSFKGGLNSWMQAQATIAASKAARKVDQYENIRQHEQMRYKYVTKVKLVNEILELDDEMTQRWNTADQKSKFEKLMNETF